MSKYVVQLLSGVILLAILVGIFLLAWHGTIPGGEAIAVVTTILGLVGGAFAVHSGVSAGATAASTPAAAPPTVLASSSNADQIADAIAKRLGATEARS